MCGPHSPDPAAAPPPGLQAGVDDSEESLRRLVACAPDAIVVTDAGGRIRQTNPQVQGLLGYTAAELLGQPLELLMGPEDAAAHAGHMAGFATARRSMTAEGREVQARRKDGSLVSVHVRVGEMPFHGERCFVGFLRDISERKRAEAERQRLQRQLMQAQKLQALGQLTGGIAHDFNNMLTGIRGLATVALQDPAADADSALARQLQEIAKVSQRGRELIARLMSFAHPERSQAPVLRSIVPIVEEVLRMLRPSVPLRIQLSLQAAPDLPAVRHVEGDLHQIVTNLVVNACDAIGGAGQVHIAIATAPDLDCDCSSCGHPLQGDWLLLRVQDSGAGIPPAVLPRIFDPFFSTKEASRGTGLGLATVHGLVHQAGGHIVVHSSAATGTCFELLLPVPSPLIDSR